MRTDLLVVVSSRTPVYRVSRHGSDPFAPSPWTLAGEDGTFGNRLDDPSAEVGRGPGERYRAIYCSTPTTGAFGETLAHFRPSIRLLAKLRAIDDDEPREAQLAGTLDPLDPRRGTIPADWRLRRVMASTVLDPDLRFVNLAAPSTYQYLRLVMAPDAASLRACRHVADSQAWLELLYDAADSGSQARWLPSRLIPQRHRPRAELPPAHEPQVDRLR